MTTASWAHVCLGDVVDLVSGATPKGVAEHFVEGSADARLVPFFKVGDMNLDGVRLTSARVSVHADVAEKLKMRIVPVGAVVFPKAGGAIATNKKRIVARMGAIDLNCMAAVPSPSVDSGYLKLWFESLDLAKLSDGSVLPQLSKKTMAGLSFPLPSLDEQRRIVGVVEGHLSRLDAAGQLIRQAQLRCARLRQTAAQRALAEARELSSDVQLGDLVEPGRSIAYGVLVPGPHVSEGVPLIRVGDIQDGRVNVEGMKRISANVATQFQRTFVSGGDVLLSLVGTIGRTAVVPPGLAGANVARAVGVLPLVGSALPEFVSMILSAPEIHRHLNRQAHEVARKTLNLEDVRRVLIPMPSVLEQQKILSAYRDASDAVERMRSATGATVARSEALRRSVLAAAFKGRLTHNATPADAPQESINE